MDTSDPMPPVTEIEPVDVPGVSESEIESTGVVTETEPATSVAEAEPPTYSNFNKSS